MEQSKEGYFTLALRQTQETIRTENPSWQPWVMFFLRSMQQHRKRLAEKVEREKIAVSNMAELSLQIIEHARSHGRVTIGEMIRLTGISRNTLKEHFRSLVEKNHLALRGGGRTAWYTLS